MTRLELLHIIQDNAQLLTTNDAAALLACRLPIPSKDVSEAWENLCIALHSNGQGWPSY